VQEWLIYTRAQMKQNVLIVGFGDVGARVAKRLKGQYRVIALVRKPERAAFARSLGVTPVVGDLADRRSLQLLSGLAPTVLHFAPPPASGAVDQHTKNLLAALSTSMGLMLSQRVIYISTTGVYGDCAGALIDETHAMNPTTDRAKRRVDAERRLRAWSLREGRVVTILRAPGIYAEDRLPIERLQRGTPALIEREDVYTNHIHADDLARAACAALRMRHSRTINVVDDSMMKMGAYFDMVAEHYGLPRAPRVTREEAALHIGPALLSFMSESRRIMNVRMKRELRLTLQYPTVRDFLLAAAPSEDQRSR
jgi:nucleoside-diphosphate-sugar epimerase